jgi:hypothetical protein
MDKHFFHLDLAGGNNRIVRNIDSVLLWASYFFTAHFSNGELNALQICKPPANILNK